MVSRAKLTYAAYATREETAEQRHEYLDGEVIGNQLAGRPCRVFESNARVRTSEAHGTYADITVVCGGIQRDSEDPSSIVNPTALVEVLSPGTEKYDRSKKFERYRNLASLREYVLVSCEEPRIESHLRNDDGTWIETFAKAGESLTMRSIDVTIDVNAVYRGLVSDGIRMVLEG